MMAAVPYRRTFVRLLTYLRPYKLTLWASIVLAVASQAAQFGTAYITSTALEKAVHGHDRHLIKLIVAAILLIGLGRALAMMGRRLIAGKQALGVEFDMRSDVYAQDRKSTRLNSSHVEISYAVFCLKKKKKKNKAEGNEKKKKTIKEEP